MSYSLLVRKNPQRHPGSLPFTSPGDISFEADDQAQLHLSSPQAGYLYVINEGPALTGGLPDFVVMFPNAGGSAQVAANQRIQIPSPSGKPELDWFEFDEEVGVEKVWLIWSERSVSETEVIKGWANPKDKGVIGDSSKITAVLRQQQGEKAAAAQKLSDEGSQLYQQGTAEALRNAIQKYERALSLWRELGDRKGQALALLFLGRINTDLGEGRQALQFYAQALPLHRAVGDRGGEASTLSNIGVVYDAFGEKQKALDFYVQALPLQRTVGDRGGEAITLGNIAYAERSLKFTGKINLI